MPELASESFYLFLIERGGQWMAATKNGRVCVARNPALLMAGSPVIAWDATSASVPAVDVYDVRGGEADAEMDYRSSPWRAG